MIKEKEYVVLSSFGGGKFNSLNDSYGIIHIRNKKFTVDEFLHIMHKFIAYGLIRGEKEGLPVFNYKARFGLTRKGSNALECYKDMRYHHTDKKKLLNAEGKAMITLAGENKRKSV